MTTPDGPGGAPYQHLETLPFALAVIHDSRIVHANAALRELLGFPREEVVGRLFELFSPQQQPFLAERHARRLRGEPVPDSYETVMRTARGERRVELSISMRGPETWVLVRDLSGRVVHRQLLQRLASLGASLPGLPDEEEVLRRVFEGLAELELSYGYLVPDGERVWLGHAFVATGTAAGEARLTGQHLVDVPGTWSPMLRLAWTDGSAHGEDFARETAWFVGPDWAEPVRTHLRRVGPLRSVCVRIDQADRPRALLAVAADWLSEEELPPLRLFAAQVSAALEAARTISRLSTHNTALTALSRLAAVAATAPEPRAFFGPGTEEIIGLLRCAAVLLLLRTESKDELELVWHQGATEEAVHPYRRMPIRGTMPGKVIELGIPMVLQADDFPEPVREDLRRQGSSSVAMVPLQARSRMVGTLVVTFSQHRLLSAMEQETLQAMGAHFAAAIESHRLLQQVRGRAEELARLHAELEHTQRQLVEHERLAALGELSAIVAHEVRNPLGVIFNAVASLRRLLKAEGDAAMLLDILSEESDRLNRMVGELLDYTRPRETILQPEDVSRVLRDALDFAGAQQQGASQRVTFSVDVAADVPRVPLDRRLIRQVLVNVLVNALHAMPQGGVVQVRARREPHGNKEVLRIDVADQGCGIPTELVHRVFEPFFTTKAQGTGLGLAVVKRNIEEHHGELALESTPGRGTTFTFRIPLTQPTSLP